MLPNPPELLKCNVCGQNFLRYSLASGNTFGATFFSDGKCEAPMLPYCPKFSKCPNCGTFLWVQDVKVVQGGALTELPGDYPVIDFLSLDEAFDFLVKGPITSQRSEFTVRLEIWWDYNDRIRPCLTEGTREGVRSWPGKLFLRPGEEEVRWRDNLTHLLRLAMELQPDNLLLLAELHRHLGHFEEALALLRRNTESQMGEIVQAMVRACQEENRFVIII